MKRTVQMLTVWAVAGMLGFTSAAYAQTLTDLTQEEIQMVQKKRERKAQFKAKMKEKLGLTDEQQQQLDEHRMAHREKAKQYWTSKKDLKQQLRAELEKSEFDLQEVQDIHDQLKFLKSQMSDHRLNGILRVREILTAEQFKKFMEFREQHKGKWRDRHKGSHSGFGMH